jgi:undecaprenyl diphosphate synthase
VTVANSNTTRGDERSRDIPAHVAIIMDGNGRWAKRRSLPRHAGHRSGVKSVRQTVEQAANRGIGYVTLFAFSSENWRRPAEEVSRLMGLFLEALQREVDDLHRNNVRVTFIGERNQLQDDLVGKIDAAERKTKDNDGLQLTVAVAYGGRWDIVNAARKVAARVSAGELSADELDDEEFAAELALGDTPDPDLLIRTGGEQRISNFLLWNLAYAELYFCDSLWPDFSEQDFDKALEFYASRQRRYGFTGDQVA